MRPVGDDGRATTRLGRAGQVLRVAGLDVLGAIAAVAYALPSLDYPFGMDQPIHWYIGQRWLEGELPFVSGVSTKPPGVFAVHAASIALFGDHQRSVRIVDLIFVLVAGAAIATFRAPGGGPRRPGELGAAWIATAAVTYTLFDWNALGHPDLWQGTLMLTAAWAVVRAPRGVVSARRAFAAGAIACVAVTFKHVAALSGVVFGAAVVALALHRRAWRDAGIGALAYTGGVALVLALTILPFVVGGAWGAFQEVMVELILRYAAAGADAASASEGWSGVAHGGLAILAGFGAACAAAVAALLRRDRSAVATTVAALLAMLCALGSVVVQDRAVLPSFEYHWLPLAPALALGLFLGARALAPRHPAISFAIIALLAAATFLAGPAWLSTPGHGYRAEWAAFVGQRRGAISIADRRAAYVGNHPRLDCYARQAEVAARIRARRRPGDTLCVHGYFGAIHQLTGLRCTSRFIVPPEAMDGALPAWRDEHARALRARPPTFLVTTSARPDVIEARRREGYCREDVHDGVRPWFVILARCPRYSM